VNSAPTLDSLATGRAKSDKVAFPKCSVDPVTEWETDGEGGCAANSGPSAGNPSTLAVGSVAIAAPENTLSPNIDSAAIFLGIE